MKRIPKKTGWYWHRLDADSPWQPTHVYRFSPKLPLLCAEGICVEQASGDWGPRIPDYKGGKQ
jgi:hypothetical protein